MVIATADSSLQAALYPPTVVAPAQPLSSLPFLIRFVDNPLKAIPAPVYTEPMVVLRQGGLTMAWVTAPELVEQVLIAASDDVLKTSIDARVLGAALGSGVLLAEDRDWRWQRRTMAPLFRPAEIANYVPAFGHAAENALQRWQGSEPGTRQAIDEAMTDATFEVIAATMFAGIEPDEAAAIKQATHDYLARSSWEIAYTILQFPNWLWHPAKRQMRTTAIALREVIAKIVARSRAERRSSPRDGDLLGRLIAARDPDTGEAMADALLIDNLATLLLAGHETTAKALTWSLFLLARAPDIQARVREEVVAVAGGAPITAIHVEGLQYTAQVLKEAMRLYPPAPVIGRMPRQPLSIGGQNFPAGSMLVIPIWAVHRHKKLWDDPDRFDPDRFTPEREKAMARTQFMPFGAGPRVCLGGTFAMAEATAMLATLVRGARYEWDGRHVPEPVSRVTLWPKGGMPLLVTPI